MNQIRDPARVDGSSENERLLCQADSSSARLIYYSLEIYNFRGQICCRPFEMSRSSKYICCSFCPSNFRSIRSIYLKVSILKKYQHSVISIGITSQRWPCVCVCATVVEQAPRWRSNYFKIQPFIFKNLWLWFPCWRFTFSACITSIHPNEMLSSVHLIVQLKKAVKKLPLLPWMHSWVKVNQFKKASRRKMSTGLLSWLKIRNSLDYRQLHPVIRQ